MRKRYKNITLFQYGGKISDNLITVNTADLKLVDFLNTLNYNEIDGDIKLYLEKLESKIHYQNIKDSITFSDDRLIFLACQIMIKYPKAKNFIGLNDWVIFYQYLLRFYDKGLHDIDKIIRYTNLYIGLNFVSEEALSEEELTEIMELSDEIKNNNFDYSQYLPNFVIESIYSKIELTEDSKLKISNKKVDILFNRIFETLGV